MEKAITFWPPNEGVPGYTQNFITQFECQVITNAHGEVVWQGNQEPFGSLTPSTETVENNFRFPGQYYDSETGLHYNWHRYYNPETGRYLRVDPIGFWGGDVNLYQYANGNPVRWTDPMGLFVTGEWIKQPRFILNDFGLDYNGFVAPSISWQGYIKIISLKGHASGYINIDVKCKKEDECGLEEWDIHGKVDVNASKTFTWGPLNIVGLIVGAKTGPIAGAAINLLIAEASLSKVEHDVVDMIQQKAIPTIRQLKKHGPNVICNFSNFLRD